MEATFCASICQQGVHGGAIKLTDDYFMFCAQKTTIADELKLLKIPYGEVSNIRYTYYLFFPMIEIILMNAGVYKFIVFNEKRFKKVIEEKTGKQV